MEGKHCFKELIWYWFNIWEIGFFVWETLISMHQSSALKRTRPGRYFLIGLHFPKWTDVTEWQNVKRFFVNLKKTQQITEIRF